MFRKLIAAFISCAGQITAGEQLPDRVRVILTVTLLLSITVEKLVDLSLISFLNKSPKESEKTLKIMTRGISWQQCFCHLDHSSMPCL